jgi:hypothetical protein
MKDEAADQCLLCVAAMSDLSLLGKLSFRGALEERLRHSMVRVKMRPTLLSWGDSLRRKNAMRTNLQFPPEAPRRLRPHGSRHSRP